MTLCNTAIIFKRLADGQVASLVYVNSVLFVCFFVLGRFLDFASHADGFVFSRSLCVEVKMGVCSGEVLSRLLLGFYCYIYFWKSLSRSTAWEVRTRTVHLLITEFWLTGAHPFCLFFFCFLHCCFPLNQVHVYTFKTLDFQTIQYRCCITTHNDYIQKPVCTQNGQKYNIQHIWRVFNSIESRLLWVTVCNCCDCNNIKSIKHLFL